VYDPATNRWTSKTPLPRARWGAANAVLNGKLYVMGGVRPDSVTAQRDTLRETIVYDPATDKWTVRASLPVRRSGITGSKVLVNGQPRIEVIGGVAPNNNVQYIP
jgi:N-acetylneuraminic acid mutarotase